jgi:hypothetical protein
LRLAICTPAYRNQVHSGLMFQLLNLVRASGEQNQIILATVDTCFLDLGRNHLLNNAVSQECHWALMCDADTFCTDPKSIVDMLNEGAEKSAAVIAAPVQLRGRDDYNAQIGAEYLKPEQFRGKVQKIDRVGTAFMAINCRWVREHWPEHPWFQSRVVPGPNGIPNKMSEDFEFCDGVTSRGGEILLDGRLEPHHAGITTETMAWQNVSLMHV